MKELSGQKRGKIGELIAIKKLIESGFDVYDNLVDDMGIDAIVRIETKDGIHHKDISCKRLLQFNKRQCIHKTFKNCYTFDTSILNI